MLSINDYSLYLRTKGKNLSEVRRNESDRIMNATFTGDVGYRRVYLLDKDKGWVFTDAKYSRHSKASISKDDVDSYLQFRPKEHHPIGTYVFIPDDTSPDLDIDYDNPLSSANIANLWMIVGRNNANQYVRYLIIRVNYDFKWVTIDADSEKHIMHCLGCVRAANSYTSGVWTDEYTTSLDNLSNAWLPNTYYVYGNKLKDYGLCDTRGILIQTRMMITVNVINPNCYYVSKILDMVPPGILKLSLKQDDYNPKTDDIMLMVCDYKTVPGNIQTGKETPDVDAATGTSVIKHMVVNDASELVDGDDISTVSMGETYYFSVKFSDDGIDPQWRINAADSTLNKLVTIREVGKYSISLKVAKSVKVKGITYKLSVCDLNGDYASDLNLEVI